MTTMELNEKEAKLLHDVLESDLSDLRMEISNTDSQTFKEGLKEKEGLISGLLKKLVSAN
ncbi:MAG: hypothetical protein HZA77_15745 [Candidatus Schekmanbacteria bacterium]|nr:hypothetical protein [Candidatus Schekmanbacteria bacterium]